VSPSELAQGRPLADWVPHLAGRRILVVGDLVLDEYLTGTPARVSREAPVLELDELEREYRAGSAGSPAANVVALGSAATIVGAIGCDGAGDRLAASLAELGIDCAGLVRTTAGPTATKTRILAQGYTGGLYGRQQVLRINRVAPLAADVEATCAARVADLAERHDAVLLSDYRGGVVGPRTIAAARAAGRPITVDSQGDLRRFRGADLVKVNHAEAQRAVGDDRPLAHADALRRELELGVLVVTLGGAGMALFSDDGHQLVPAARVSQVFDVTGAGDTVIAVLTLALVAGVPLAAAAALANAAAGLVVQRLGVATVTPDELVAALRR
jgi:D-glycero-beta-D-manno-heptose-7-phosphate kinase